MVRRRPIRPIRCQALVLLGPLVQLLQLLPSPPNPRTTWLHWLRSEGVPWLPPSQHQSRVLVRRHRLQLHELGYEIYQISPFNRLSHPMSNRYRTFPVFVLSGQVWPAPVRVRLQVVVEGGWILQVRQSEI